MKYFIVAKTKTEVHIVTKNYTHVNIYTISELDELALKANGEIIDLTAKINKLIKESK